MTTSQTAQNLDRSAGGIPAWETRESALLASFAMRASRSAGRTYDEPQHAYRSPFQRDRDRVLHSSAFRRLSGKMQVFTGEMGDYHRTRLTHTHEVANIARTIGRVLRLNEDLIEALALVHDIGHPPYGHSGEDALDECLQDHGGFSHNAFALELVQNLETRYTTYPGLNLTKEVLSGQHFRITHEGHTPLLEVQVVDLADSIAYNAHDVDDALALNLISVEQIESLELVDIALQYGEARGHTRTAEGLRQSLVHSLIDVQVVDLLESARAKLSGIDGLDCRAVSELGIQLSMTPVVASRREQLAQFLFDHVYRHETLMRVRKAASDRVQSLFDRLVANPEFLPDRFREIARRTSAAVAAGQYIAGMTDRFCDTQHESIVQQGRKSALPW